MSEDKSIQPANAKKLRAERDQFAKDCPSTRYEDAVEICIHEMRLYSRAELEIIRDYPRMPGYRVAAAIQCLLMISPEYNRKGEPLAGAAFDRMFDRLRGKPKQVNEHSGPQGGPMEVTHTINLDRLSDDELRQYRDLRLKADASHRTNN